MSEDLLLGIDIGTQGVKGILVTAQGRVEAEAYVEHSCRYPQPGWAEHDLRQNWWRNPVRVIRALLNNPIIRPEQVKALCPSGLHPNFGPTDKDGEPIYGAILYCDNRAVKELGEINRSRKLKLTSEELTPKLVWFLRNEPAAGAMKRFFDAAQYLVFKLTGEYVTDTISVGGWGAIYHSPTSSWKLDVCEELGIPASILPRVVPPLTLVGEVHAQGAEETGLPIGTPVIAGTNDVTASTMSAGAVNPSEAIAYYGTAGLLPVMKVGMDLALRQPYPNEERGLKPQDGYLFDYPAYSLSTGDSLRWFRDEFGSEERQVEANEGISTYTQFDRLAQNVLPGAEGLIFLPYLLGQRSPQFKPHTNGAYIGIKRMHSRAHFFRALLEAWGYTIRYGLESYYPNGHPLQRLIAAGGGARSSLWRQIVTDITGIPQEYAPNAEGSIADAYLAGMALGWFKDFDVLLKEWIAPRELVIPNPDRAECYQKPYQGFVRLHTLLEPFYTEMGEE